MANCTKYIRKTLQRCTQWQDDGYSQCTQWADHGYSACSAWQSHCCDWAPCSWFCKLITWLCVAWVWISNLVCVASVWVAHLVCVAWAYVSYAVCVAWSAVVAVGHAGWDVGHAFYDAVVSFVNAVTVPGNCKDARRNPLEKKGWELLFSDDFAQGALDPTKWSDMPYWGHRWNDDAFSSGNTPLVYWSPVNYDFAASSIRLFVQNTPFGPVYDAAHNVTFSTPFTGAWVAWRDGIEQKHGYFEIRCKLPWGHQLNPAFWLCCRGPYPWPPELDILEQPEPVSEYWTTLHWGKDPNHPSEGRKHYVCRPSEYFHIYACEWGPDKIQWYRDNRHVRTTTKGLEDFVYPMHVILELNVQPGATTTVQPYPQYFEVDYVRCYRKA